MTSERFKLCPCVYLVIKKQGHVLLLLRKNTGYCDGMYAIIGGHADGNETIRQAVAREALEEGGITVDPNDLVHVHTMHRLSNRENIDMFFTTDRWQGEIVNAEPDKCAELAYYPLTHLPENTLPYIKHVFDQIEKGIHYSEYGWEH